MFLRWPLAYIVSLISLSFRIWAIEHVPLRERASDNLQSFTGTLGSPAPAITQSSDASRPFEVDGDTFPDFATAGQRSCSDQFNSCQLAANSGGASFSVSDCENQQTQCNAAQAATQDQSFDNVAAAPAAAAAQTAGSQVNLADFDVICDD